MKIDFDVDIDMANRDNLLSVLRHVKGSIKRPDGFEKHNTGVYIQPIPHNPLTGLSTLGILNWTFLTIVFTKVFVPKVS